jgi:16S rRNA C967 or C1407 C5-methylase (RsmB/RsmF family)
LLPTPFLDSLAGLPGFDKNAFEQVHAQGEQITSVRLNKYKQFDFNSHPFLKPTTPVSWCDQGLYLSERPLFVLDPLWHAGAYYVQEASSMFIQHLLHQLNMDTTSIVLDLCAAPGGKSTLLANWFKDGLVVANETIKGRNAILVENITKWGADNMIVTQNDPGHFKALPAFFDLVLIDAPCSGLGTLRRNPDVKWRQTEQSLAELNVKQISILHSAARLVKPGGRLVYATCSLLDEENDAIAEQFLAVHEDFHLVNMSAIMTEQKIDLQMDAYLKMLPNVHHTDGFFAAVFERKKLEVGVPSKEPAIDTQLDD